MNKNAKSSKWIVYSMVVLVLLLAVLFVWLYPQLDRSAKQAISDIRTGTFTDNALNDANSDDSLLNSSGVPTPAPEALATGLCGVGETIHDTATMGEGPRDYTLHSISAYDTIDESPISLSECIKSASYDTYIAWKFVLLDMSVTNTSDSEMEPLPGEEYQFLLDLIPRSEGNSQLLYFSAHPDNTYSDSDYYKFNLAPGDTLDFQIGIFINPTAWEEQSVYLQVGYDNESGVGFSYFS